MAEETKTPETEKTKPEKKKNKKDVEIESLKAELESKNDLLLRTAAEFDNYKKRTEREKLNVAEFAKAGSVKQLLPILDNIDRAALAEKDTPDYIKGIEMIVKQFEGIAGNIGITEVANVVSLVVSEETGIISIIKQGNVTRYADYDMLLDALKDYYWQEMPLTDKKQQRR